MYNFRLYQEMIDSLEHLNDANNASTKLIRKESNVGKL